LAEQNTISVFVSSDRALLALETAGSIGYAINKAALNMVVKKFSKEPFADAIQSVAVHPGWVRTDWGESKAH
jgi:NAD(P)-dependent dehydrogenase (short-subunit alcohol dehydrogenase family)